MTERAAPDPRVSGSGGLGCRPRFCISDKFQVMMIMMILLFWRTNRLLRMIALSTFLYLTTWESGHEHPSLSKCNNPNPVTSRWQRSGVRGHRHCEGQVRNWQEQTLPRNHPFPLLYRNQQVKQKWVEISMQLRWENAPILLQVFWRNEVVF